MTRITGDELAKKNKIAFSELPSDGDALDIGDGYNVSVATREAFVDEVPEMNELIRAGVIRTYELDKNGKDDYAKDEDWIVLTPPEDDTYGYALSKEAFDERFYMHTLQSEYGLSVDYIFGDKEGADWSTMFDKETIATNLDNQKSLGLDDVYNNEINYIKDYFDDKFTFHIVETEVCDDSDHAIAYDKDIYSDRVEGNLLNKINRQVRETINLAANELRSQEIRARSNDMEM